MAIDNEQYVSWMKARFGREIDGGDGFRAIAELLDSKVEYQQRDALDLDGLDEQFDMIFCFGILHRVENPLGLLRAARTTLAEGGSVLVETYGSEQDSDGFRAIAELLDSKVEYQTRDALDLDGLDEQFDKIFCFGILHRVENPLGLLRAARTTLAEGGSVLVETYGSEQDSGAAIEVHERGDVHTSDDFFYWGFPVEGLRRLGALAGFEDFELIDTPTVDGLPRIIGRLTA